MADVQRVQQQIEIWLRLCKRNILGSDVADNQRSIGRVNSVFRNLDYLVGQVCSSMESNHPDCHILLDCGLWLNELSTDYASTLFVECDRFQAP